MTRPRALIIDDDHLFRSLMTSLLRKDFVVSVAVDGSEGYYKALEHAPDVAVVDVQMPGWDGLKTLKAFRAHAALVQIPVIMLTVDASKETVLAAIRAGANDYVIKTGFNRDDFVRKLYRLVKLPPPDPSAPESRPQSGAPVSATQSPVPVAGAALTAAPQPPHARERVPTFRDGAVQDILDSWE